MRATKIMIVALMALCWNANADVSQTGVRRASLVIKDVWRAGGRGGMNSMPKDLVFKLCQQGVNQAFYLYPDKQFGGGNFAGRGSYDCTTAEGKPNTLTYDGAKFVNMSGARKILEAVQAKIQGGQPGQILFHCWNGHHATGEIAAYIKMQFCGYSASQAADYFERMLGHAMTANERSVKNRIARQTAFGDLRITDAQAAEFCGAGQR